MTLEEFDQLFDQFERTAFHLETHQTYAISEEDERLRAFREGHPRPERSVRTSPWLRRVAVTTAQGKHWSRVHIIEQPLTEYLRYQLVGYVESQAAGEQIRLADRGQHPELAQLGPDFWLFDGGSPVAFGALLYFDNDGELITIEHAPPGMLQEMHRQQRVVVAHSVSLAEYLATQGA